jgi:hypothetical protein
VADKEHFIVKQDHSHGGFYWQTAIIKFARHTARLHPAERQVVTGNSALVPSRCRPAFAPVGFGAGHFEATGRYARSWLTTKIFLDRTEPPSEQSGHIFKNHYNQSKDLLFR